MERGSLRPALALAFVALLLTLAIAVILLWRPGGSPPPTGSLVIPSAPSGELTVLVGAGDIAECGDDDDEATADIVAGIPGTVFLAGDNAYRTGSPAQYRDCYAPSRGTFLARTHPVPGDNEYDTRGAAGYLEYFGTLATPAGRTWYSWEAGDWHVVMLDSNCDAIGGCEATSPEAEWLRADLAASTARCTLAIWHHPRFSSGYHGNHDFMQPMMQPSIQRGCRRRRQRTRSRLRAVRATGPGRQRRPGAGDPAVRRRDRRRRIAAIQNGPREQ